MELMLDATNKTDLNPASYANEEAERLLPNLARHWLSELELYKNKAVQMLEFIELDAMSDEQLRRRTASLYNRLLTIVDEDFFQLHYHLQDFLTSCEANLALRNAPPRDLFLSFNELQACWQDLKRRYLDLEMTIVRSLFSNYPLRIF